jgi:hypothetical protein
MKKSTLVGGILIAFLFLISSCAKDQQALNKLKGSWRYTKISALGITLDIAQTTYANATIQFDECSAKSDRCSGRISATGTAPVPFLYEINKKGDEVTVSDSTTTTIYKIKKLDKSNLVYSTSYDTIINATPFKLELEFTCVK